jgi:uncharacterized delta-60 repeat protein
MFNTDIRSNSNKLSQITYTRVRAENNRRRPWKSVVASGMPAALACVALFISPSALRAQAGRLDATFGNAGKVLTKNANGFGQAANTVALQSDGKIVVAGSLTQNGNFGFVRYNANGSLDSSFGSGGIVSINPGGSADDVVLGIAIQSDGKILAAGPVNAANDFFMIRLNTNGTLDMAFGSAGIAAEEACIPNSGALTVQPNGEILVVGGCAMLFEPSGALDSTFGTNGVARLVNMEGGAVALQSDGKFLVAGFAGASGGIISRYNANGSIDTSFGIFGSAGCPSPASAIAVQSDGKIVVAGTLTDLRTSPGTQALAVFRYNPDGSVDETFGTHGGALADFFSAPASAAAFAVAIETNGDIVAAGQASSGSSPSQFALARFTALGQLDPSFGTNGLVNTSFGQMDSVAALAIQTDGKIVAAGNSTGNSQFGPLTTVAIARYTAE